MRINLNQKMVLMKIGLALTQTGMGVKMGIYDHSAVLVPCFCVSGGGITHHVTVWTMGGTVKMVEYV